MKTARLSLILILLGLIVYPAQAAAAAVQAIRLCGTAVIPALFPYMVLCRLITALHLLPAGHAPRTERRMQALFGVGSGVLPALLLSYLGGYPVGVTALCNQYRNGLISRSECERALRFCNNSGPAFFLGMLGGQIFHSMRAGLLLYAMHILSSLCVGILTASPATASAAPRSTVCHTPDFGSAFLSAVQESCHALLQICGLVLSFRVLLGLLEATGITQGLPDVVQSLLTGLLELTCGILGLHSGPAAFVLAAFLMGWGGLCVQLQAASLYRPLDLHPQGCRSCKLLHGLLSALFAWACCTHSPASLLLCAVIVTGVVLAPQIRKKRAGNLQHVAV